MRIVNAISSYEPNNYKEKLTFTVYLKTNIVPKFKIEFAICGGVKAHLSKAVCLFIKLKLF